LLDVPVLTDGVSALSALELFAADTFDFDDSFCVLIADLGEAAAAVEVAEAGVFVVFDDSPENCSTILVNAFIALSHAP
jgi:hypothetical protein